MTVPVLPVIEAPPPRVFFQVLERLAIALALALSWIFCCSVVVMLLPMCIAPPKRRRKLCCSSMKTWFLFMARRLCVNAFPALFKTHKTRGDCNSEDTREFIVLLDRKVENNWVLISAFCSLACGIYSASAIVFFYYFPVQESEECLVKDQSGRTLFCYSNSSINPSIPVDCTQYNVTEFHELHFQCYAIALPGFGIAFAAAFGLAKLATFVITFYVKVTEMFYKITKNHSQKLKKSCSCCVPQRWCWCHSRICANRICIYSSRAILGTVTIVSLVFSSLVFRHNLTQKVETILYLYDFARAYLPTLMLIPLLKITNQLEGHCMQGEYISSTSDQRPPDSRDWDIDMKTESTGVFGSSANVGEQDDTVGHSVLSSSCMGSVSEARQAESRVDSAIAQNEANSDLVIENPSYLTPLPQDQA